MHSKKSAISLSWMVLPFPTVGSLVIVFQVRNSVRPMHLFGHTRDHDYYFELPREGTRDLWLNHCCRGGGCMQRKMGLRVVFLFTVLAIAGGYAVVRFWHPSLVESGIV